MIYTCTFNPSLDYYLDLEKFSEGRTNRSFKEEYRAGGKGVNVSIVLNNFGIQSTAIGFLGGFYRDYYLKLLTKYPYLQALFTNIESNSRINVKLSTDKETGINANGPIINEEEWEKFKRRLNKITKHDIIVFSGNIQEALEAKVIEVIKELSNNKVAIILDTNPKLVRKCLKYQPILIKPNYDELCMMFDEQIEDSFEALIQKAKVLASEGAANVLVSLGENGSIMVSGNDVYYVNGVDFSAKNTVGAGDSMVAGFILSLLRGANSIESYRYAIAASYATINSDNLGVRKDIERYYEKVEVLTL